MNRLAAVFLVFLVVLSFDGAGGHVINSIKVVTIPSVIDSWDSQKSSSLIRETKDFRVSFIQRELPVEEHIMYRIYIQKCGDKSGYLLYADKPITVYQCLDCIDSIDPSKNGTSYAETTQPQIKLIRKNAVFQTGWQQTPTKDFLAMTLESGDLLYIACFD